MSYYLHKLYFLYAKGFDFAIQLFHLNVQVKGIKIFKRSWSLQL
jgi:hypothetical protein